MTAGRIGACRAPAAFERFFDDNQLKLEQDVRHKARHQGGSGL
jgi:hypothetical protein